MNIHKVSSFYFLIIFTLLGLISNGCFFGTFQTAETLGAGNVGSTAYVMVPTYGLLDTSITGEEFLESVSAGGFFQIGATNNFDVGLILSTAGIGAQGKLRFTPGARKSSRTKSGRTRSSGRRRRRRSSNPFDVATIITVNYNLWTGGLLPKFDLIGSIRFNEFFSLYGGGQLFYIANLDLDESQFNTKMNKEVYLGINVRRSEKITPGLDWIPSSLYIEFGYPLDLEERAVLFGIGIGGANLPALFGSCLGAMGD